MNNVSWPTRPRKNALYESEKLQVRQICKRENSRKFLSRVYVWR